MNQPHLGVTHFLDFMYDGEPEWALFAIRAPLDEVSQALAEYRQAKRRVLNVPHLPSEEGDELAHLAVVLQVRDNPWTVGYRSLLWVDSVHLRAVPEEATKLSDRFHTRAVAFFAEDTSGAMAYEIVESGQSLEHAEWECGGEFSSFKSTLRQRPDLEEVGDEFADEIFTREGIYLPACYPREVGGKPWLAVEKASAKLIGRADLLEL